MRSNDRGLVLAVTLAGTLFFSACGGDDNASDTSGTSEEATPTASSSSDSDDGAESPEGDGTATGDATNPGEDAEADDGDADGVKPARGEVVAGYENVITDQSPVELPADIVKQTATCFVDEIYDQASAQTLQAIAEENAAGIDPNDASLFSEASVTCTKAAAG